MEATYSLPNLDSLSPFAASISLPLNVMNSLGGWD